MRGAATEGSFAASIAVRPATLADQDALGTLYRESYSHAMATHYPPSLLVEVLPLLTQPNKGLIADGTFYVAQSGPEILGCGGWSAIRPGRQGGREDGLAHLRHFATAPKVFGRGIGKSIFKRCVLDAGLLGFRSLEVYASLNAEGFYQTVGFTGVEPLSLPIGKERFFPAIRMTKEL